MPASYTVNPEVGQWEEQNVVFEFEDGWKICEDKTAKDLTELGRITKNCIAARWLTQLLPTPENETDVRIKAARATWDTPLNEERRGREWIEQMIADAVKVPTNRTYKIMHLEDQERRPYCAIILGEKGAVEGRTCSYSASRDLGQETTVTFDGFEFYLLQATWTVAWMPPVAAQRLPIWWQATSPGEWSEEKFQESVKRYSYAYEKQAA